MGIRILETKEIQQEEVIALYKANGWSAAEKPPDDVPFLEDAISTQADALITGNKNYFPKTNCVGIRVLFPFEFVSGRTK